MRTESNYTRVRQSTLGTKAQSGAQRYDSKGIAIPMARPVRLGRKAHTNAVAHLLTR